MPEIPSLLDELGLEESRLSWDDLASCKGMDSSLFFKQYEDDPQIAKAMDEVCLNCPVMANCFFEEANLKGWGLRGGIYLDQGKPDKMRNAHKTPEVWARIKERLYASS